LVWSDLIKDKKRVEVISIFASPIVRINIGDFTKAEMECVNHIPLEKNKEKKQRNHQSKDYYLFDSHVDKLGDIKKFIENWLNNYLEEIEGADTNVAGLRITQSWLNKTKPGESHHPHTHANSYLSGVLYFHCLPNDFINFDNRMYRMFNNMEFPKKKLTAWNSGGFNQKVTKGDLLLFPSWVAHSVGINETKETERISLSFNTFPIGELGNPNGATHLKL
jgi:uncharacterized protein (TIGR02466 family)